MLRDAAWDAAGLERVIHEKLLRTPSVSSVFDVVANPSERDDGTCDVAAACADLYASAEHAEAVAALEAAWADLGAAAFPSTEAWRDDGPLADPQLFGGTWSPWRDADGLPIATYQLSADAPPGAGRAGDSRRRLGAAAATPPWLAAVAASFFLGWTAGRVAPRVRWRGL